MVWCAVDCSGVQCSAVERVRVRVRVRVRASTTSSSSWPDALHPGVLLAPVGLEQG